MHNRLFGQKSLVFLQTSLILIAMAGIPALVGYQLFGTAALLIGGMTGIAMMLFVPRVSPQRLLSARNVRRLRYGDARRLFSMVNELTRRGNLNEPPQLGLIQSPTPNAFTVGRKHDSAVVITTGLVNLLTSRQLSGVLAHEIAHIKNGDLSILSLADAVRRVTSLMSRFAVFLLIFSVPMLLFTSYSVPFSIILLLFAAPTLSLLLQMALSRGREFNADAVAVELTGDPAGLASALDSISHPRLGFFDYFFPVRRKENTSLFRSHPSTEERIRRLGGHNRYMGA